ncbi:MAG: thiol reductase thioredoxin, partial [Ignavibacteriaceae bacterium]
MTEHLNKEKFLEKVFDFEKDKEWKFKGEIPAVI